MERSRRIVVVAHCLLNVNSRVEGIARYAGVHPIIGELAGRGLGIIQLPCPELSAGGCTRPKATLEEYDTPEYRASCDVLAAKVAEEVVEYLRCGYRVGPVIGTDGSPSCGVIETTMATGREPGSGVFMRALAARLEPVGVEFTAVDGRDPASVDRVLELVDEVHGTGVAGV